MPPESTGFNIGGHLPFQHCQSMNATLPAAFFDYYLTYGLEQLLLVKSVKT